MNQDFSQTETKETLLKATAIARILNISRAMAYRLIQQGEIRSVWIGSARRVRGQDLANFIANNTNPAVE